MNPYTIVTDSTADLTLEVYEKYGIEVIPMEFVMEEKTYQHYADAREMGFTEFYQNLREGKLSSTSQINYYTYESVFRPLLEAGQDILYIVFSSGLSGTYQASQLVIEDLREEFPDRKILSVDSLSASIGEGALVFQAALRRQEGYSLEDLYEWTKENRYHACHWFIVDDLFHLKRGGRINALEATLGSALNLKPLLSVDDNGKLVTVSKLRGSKRIVETFVERFKAEGFDLGNQTVVVGHADNRKQADKIADRLRELGLVRDVVISDIGPIIGTHVGSGMVALAFLGKRSLAA